MALANLTARSQRVYIGSDAQEWSFAAAGFLPEHESMGESGIIKTFASITLLEVLSAPESIDPRANPDRWREGNIVRVDVATDAGGWFTWGLLRLLEIPSGPTTDGRITLQLGCALAWADDPQPEGDRSEVAIGVGENSATVAARLLVASGIDAGDISLGTWDYELPYTLQKEGSGSYVQQAGALAWANHCRQLYQAPDGTIQAAQWSNTPGTSVATVTVGQNEALFEPSPDPVPPVERVIVSGVGYQPSTTPERYSSSFTVTEPASNFSDSAVGTVAITTTEVYEYGIPDGGDKDYFWTYSETRLRQPQAATWIGSDSTQPATMTTYESKRYDATTKILYRIETGEIANVRTLVDSSVLAFGTTLLQRTITDLTHDASQETLTRRTETTTVPRIVLTGDTGETGRFVQETARVLDTRWTEDRPDYWVERTSERVAAKNGSGRQGNIKPTALVTQRPQIKPNSRPPATDRWEDPTSLKEQHYTATCTWQHPGGATGRVRTRSLTVSPGFSNAQCFEIATREVQLLEGRRESYLIELPLADALLWLPPLSTIQVDDGANLWTFRLDAAAWEYAGDSARLVAAGICVARVPVEVPVGVELPTFATGVEPGQVAPAEPPAFVVPTDEVRDVEVALSAAPAAISAAAIAKQTAVVALSAAPAAIAAEADLTPAVAVALSAAPASLAAEAELRGAVSVALSAAPAAIAAEVVATPAVAVALSAAPAAIFAQGVIVTPWTPADTATEQWIEFFDSATIFDAASGGSTPAADGEILRVEDKSGNSRHLTATNGPARKVALVGGIDGAQFDGTNDRMERAAFLPNTFTVVGIMKKTDLTNVNTGWLSQNASVGGSGRTILYGERDTGTFRQAMQVGTLAIATGARTGGFNIYSYTRSSTTANFYYNGASAVSGTVGSATVESSTFAIGASNSTGTDFTDHQILGYVVISGVATTDIRQRLEGYFAHAAGLESTLDAGHPYRTNPPTV